MTSQAPTPGRIVMAVGFLARSNGTDTCPAIITRVWGQAPDGGWTVNATIFRDNAAPNHATSVTLYHDEPAARLKLDGQPYETLTVLHWPARD